jgi:hypothetical protein
MTHLRRGESAKHHGAHRKSAERNRQKNQDDRRDRASGQPNVESTDGAAAFGRSRALDVAFPARPDSAASKPAALIAPPLAVVTARKRGWRWQLGFFAFPPS